MMSSTTASASENSFGIKGTTRGKMNAAAHGIVRSAGPMAIADLRGRFVCDEPATAKHLFHVQMSRGPLSVAALPRKQVDMTKPSAGADGFVGLVCRIRWTGVTRALVTT